FTPPAVTLCDPNHIYSFTDASRDAWYSSYLCVAVQHNIIKGYSDGSFRPESRINFVEAAKIIASTSQLQNGVAVVGARNFVALSGQQWYEPYVKYLSERGVVPASVRSNAQFITRGEMVEMLFRMSGSFHAPDTTNSAWKTYEDIDGIFSMQLPGDWLAVSPYDGSFITFTTLGDGVFAYSAPDEREGITLEVLQRQYVSLQPEESLLDFAIDRFTETGKYTIQSRQEDGYVVHNVQINSDIDAIYRSYVFYERDDVIVTFGFTRSSTTTTAIQSSFQFTPKNVFR
ncbi:MAG: Uncharacterized protein Greene101449_1292, partial [Candidatus Peregrinibacteria bacterium Greene1014_49]